MWVMLGCCARLHVWALGSPRCLSGGLQPNRLLNAHFKKRENEQGRGGCTKSTIVMQSHHPISFMKFVHGLLLSDTLVFPSFHVESNADDTQLFMTHGKYTLSRRVKPEHCSGNFMTVHRVLNQVLRWELPSTCTFHVYPCLGTTDKARRAASCRFLCTHTYTNKQHHDALRGYLFEPGGGSSHSN